MWAYLPCFHCDHFLCTLTAIPTSSQDHQTLTLDKTHIQVFNQLQGRLQYIVKVVKSTVEEHMVDNADNMGTE